MRRAIKIFLIVIVAIVVLLAATLFVITQVIDPNDFKPQIREQARKEANLDLRIPGKLSWEFWPSVGVSMGRTEARIAGQNELFAAIDKASVSVSVLPLLVGKVEMNGVTLDGLQLNLKKTAQGANWQQIGPRDKSAAKAQPANTGKKKSGGMNIPLTIPDVSITNGQVRYQDTTNGTDIRVQHFNFSAQNVGFKKPFPLQMSLRYQDQHDIRVDLDLKTTLDADLDNNHYVLDPMTLDAKVAGVTSNPVDVSLKQSLDLNLADDSARINNLVLQAAGTKTTGNATVTNLTHLDKLKVTGKLDTAPFNVNDVLDKIGAKPIKTRGDKALSKVAMNATLSGKPGTVMVDPLKVTVDDSTLSGQAGIDDLKTNHIAFNLNLDKINLDGYLPPKSSKPKSEKTGGGGKNGGTAQLTDRQLIPVDSLKPLKMDGTFKVGQLGYQGINASNMVFKVHANNGLLQLTQASGQALDGKFSATASLDASAKTPQVKAHSSLSNMQIQPVATLAMGKDLAKGILTLDADFHSAGNTEQTLVANAKGNAKLDFSNGTVRGLNLYNSLVGGVNDMLGRFQGLSALIPDQKSGKLPTVLSQDTKIIDLTSDVSLDKQVATLNSLNAKLDKGTLSGNGWLNVLTQDFDLKVGMQSPQLGGGKYLENVTWPMRCAGNLTGNPASWCGPDKSGFEKVAQQAATNAAKDKIKQKLGIDAQGKDTKEVIQNAAKKKAQDEINKKLQQWLK